MGYVYNASILRFRPYRDIGEFANVGILLSFPQLDKIIFRLEKRRQRIVGFFPEIDRPLLQNAFQYIEDVFREKSQHNGIHIDSGAVVFDFLSRDACEIFQYLTSVKEGMFVFSDTISGITDNADERMDALFEYYVLRNFQSSDETREKRLEKSFRSTLTNFKLNTKFREGHLGNESYRVKIPFFNEKLSIRTLCLEREKTTEIYECGDQWEARMARLHKLNEIPSRILFPISYPKNPDSKMKNAVSETQEKLAQFDFVKIMPVTETRKVIEFIKYYCR